MSGVRLSQLSVRLAATCRVAIAASGVHWLTTGNVRATAATPAHRPLPVARCPLPGVHWLTTGNGLWAGVAAVALTLTALPGVLLQDSLLRDTTRAVVAVLLALAVMDPETRGLQAALIASEGPLELRTRSRGRVVGDRLEPVLVELGGFAAIETGN